MLVYYYCYIPYLVFFVPYLLVCLSVLSYSLVYPIPYLILLVPYCVILCSRAREWVWA